MPSITQLEYIVSVSKHKHFGRAAKECNVSQPSLSAQIQKAEEELDTVLFDRSKKPVMTTQTGQLIINQALQVLKEHKRIFDLSAETDELSGDFHLGVIPTLAPYTLPLFIEAFAKKYPKVNIQISEHKTEDIITKLYDDEIDCGLLVTPLYDDRLIERSLFFEPFYVFSSDNHEFKNRKIIKDTDLDASSVWLLDEGHCFRDQVIKVCSLKDSNQVLKNVKFSSGNLETLINLIRRGEGYTLLPHLATLNLNSKERDKNLKKFSSPVPTREVSLVHSRSFLKQRIIDALEEEIVAHTPKDLKSFKRKNINIVDI